GDETWRRFLPFDLRWAGGRIGRTVAQLHYRWYRRSEQAKARKSRDRETQIRRAAADAARRAWEGEPEVAPVTMADPPQDAPAMPVEPAMLDRPQPERDQALPAVG